MPADKILAFRPLTLPRRRFLAGTGAAAMSLAAGPLRAQSGTRSITHEFGTTEVPVAPQRIVSVGWDEHDMILSFGHVPILQRDGWGEQPYGTWPWAQDALKGQTPETFSDEMPFERILALEPDLIMATWSGIDRETWERLSAIAPTVAGHPGHEQWTAPWDVRTRFIGEVFGQEDHAEALISGIAARIADIHDSHPGWHGLTGVSVTVDDGSFAIGAKPEHSRAKLLMDFGFVIPDTVDIPTEGSHAEYGLESLSILDGCDLIVWVNGQDDSSNIVNLPLRTRLTAHREGREVYCDKVLTAAFSIQSPMSYNYLLDRLVPEIERAVDGDPETKVELATSYGIAG